MGKRYQNKKWLYGKYVDNKLSIKYIAKICKVSPSTIWAWLKKLKIPCYSQSESFHFIRANHCELSNKATEWLNGESC